jgi:hypothetical protein
MRKGWNIATLASRIRRNGSTRSDGNCVGLLASHARRIHVLFTDIQVPGTMDGLALAHHTVKHWPMARIACNLGPAPPRSRRIPKTADCGEATTQLKRLLYIFLSHLSSLRH